MKELILTTEIKQYELSENKAEQLEAVFLPMLDMLKPMEDEYNVIIADANTGIDREVTSRAKELRKSISKVRKETEEKRVAEKKESLLMGRAIDGIANIVKYAISSKEDKLKEIETHLKREEDKRLTELGNKRCDLISMYLGDVEADIHLAIKLRSMDEDVFDAYLVTKKASFEKDLAEENIRIEAQLKAEREAELEATRIREENAKLKADAEKAENERLALEEKEAIAKLESEAKQKAIEEEKAKVERKAEREKLAKMKAIKETEEATKRAEESEKRRIESEAKAKQDAIDAEKRRIAEVTAMAESSKEITLEEIERAKAEGKAVFVKVIRIESDCKESGIFITGDK